MSFTAGGSSKNKKKFKSSTPSKARRQDSGRRRRGAPVGLIVFLVILGVVIVGGLVGYITVNNEITGKRGSDETGIIVTIPEGSSTGAIAQILKDEGVIGSENIFKLYSRIFEADGSYQLGEHSVDADMHYDDIISSLQQMTYIDYNTFSITFPEGTTALRMAMEFEALGVCTIDEFVDECNNGVFTNDFLSQVSSDSLKFMKLEGFLYPDTYEFRIDITAHEIIQTMLDNFERKVLTSEILAQVEASEYTLEEIVILASMIQRESTPEYIHRVSGVFYNRMAPGSGFDKFESCTTDNFRWYVLWYYYGSEANVPAGMDYAYDSYQMGWFPVGAVCNPGVDMIDGALNPEDTPYYFFCSNVDTQEFFWAVTNEEHERNLYLAGIR